MIKKITLALFIVLTALQSKAQNTEQLEQLVNQSKTIYLKPDALDNLMISLRPFKQIHGNGVDSLLMQAYINISKGYADNNHFKQGFDVYDMYLNYKIEMLKLKKDATIAEAATTINSKRDADKTEQMKLQNNVQQLQIDIDELSTKITSFKKYFSLLIIGLALIFAAIFVSSGVKFNNLKKKISENKLLIKKGHRFALVGVLQEGLSSASTKLITEIESTIVQLRNKLKTSKGIDSKHADQITSAILKTTSELKQ